jgi:hypothetical protein
MTFQSRIEKKTVAELLYCDSLSCPYTLSRSLSSCAFPSVPCLPTPSLVFRLGPSAI